MKFMILAIAVILATYPLYSQQRQVTVHLSGGTVKEVECVDMNQFGFTPGDYLVFDLAGGSRDSVSLALIDSVTFPIAGGPAIALLEPTAGLNYKVGDSLTISWTLNPKAAVDHVTLAFSSDNGTTWHQVFNDPDNPDAYTSDTRYYPMDFRGILRWHIADPFTLAGGSFSPVSDSCKVRVAQYGRSSDPELRAISPGLFAVRR